MVLKQLLKFKSRNSVFSSPGSYKKSGNGRLMCTSCLLVFLERAVERPLQESINKSTYVMLRVTFFFLYLWFKNTTL